MWTSGISLQKTGISKHSWKKIMQFLWTVVNITFIKKNVEHVTDYDVYSAYGVCIY